MRVLTIALLASLCFGQSTASAAEGDRYAVIVQGASGEEQYATLHRGWVDALAAVLRDRFKFEDSRLFVLAETPKRGEQRATAEAVRAVLAQIATRAKPDDLLFVMLIGHGGGEGAAAKFNMIGPDLAAADWKSLLDPIAARTVLVDSTSASFSFLSGLAGPNRIVITATNSYAQRYHTYFPQAFIASLTDPAADSDKNGRVSLLEAFLNASRLVGLYYEQTGHLATERAVLDDTGDGIGREATTTGSDGVVAGLTYLDTVEAPKVADPVVQQLLVRQRSLTEEVDALRRRRLSMAPEDFDREFERLITELALVSRDVRRRAGG